MSELSLARFKRCTKCSVTQPATSDFFPRTRNERGEVIFGNQCKGCKARYWQLYRQTKLPYSKRYAAADELLARGIKQCRYCERELPATPEYFYRDKKTRSGFSNKCKNCQRAYFQNWYAGNKDEYQARREQYNAEYREANRELYRALHKSYSQTLQGKLANKTKKAKRSAQERSAEGSHTKSDIRQMLEDQGYRCAYCEIELGEDWSVDHMMPLSRGGSNWPENLAITCVPCNLRKHTRTAEEFMKLLR